MIYMIYMISLTHFSKHVDITEIYSFVNSYGGYSMRLGSGHTSVWSVA